MPLRASAETIAELREAIETIDGTTRRPRKALAFGVPKIDQRLPAAGLPMAQSMKSAAGGDDGVKGAVSALFAAGIAAMTKGSDFWCLSRTDIIAPSLSQVGLKPDRRIFVECKDEMAIAESCDEALRLGGLGVVIAELGGCRWICRAASNWRRRNQELWLDRSPLATAVRSDRRRQSDSSRDQIESYRPSL